MKNTIFAVITFLAVLFRTAEISCPPPYLMSGSKFLPAKLCAETETPLPIIAGSLPENTSITSDIKIYKIKNTESLPRELFEESRPEKKTPYIIVEPYRKIFDTKFIRSLAKDMASLDRTFFVELYPVYETPSYNISAYKDFYKKSADIFHTYAPKTQLIWAISSELIYNERELFPGGCADYVGVSLITGLNGKDNDIYNEDKLEYISYNYDLPLVITRFGCVSYSEKNHSYHKTDCYADELEAIINSFPELRGLILYEDEDFVYDGYKNRLSFGNNDRLSRIVSDFLRRKSLERIPCDTVVCGDMAYIREDDFERIFGLPHRTVYIDSLGYVNSGRYVNIEISEKNCVIFSPREV